MPDAKQAKQMFFAESRSENICVSTYKDTKQKIFYISFIF